MKLEMRRKSWDWKAQRSKVFGPVGDAPEMGVYLALPMNVDAVGLARYDGHCKGCGYHVCSCDLAPKLPARLLGELGGVSSVARGRVVGMDEADMRDAFPYAIGHCRGDK